MLSINNNDYDHIERERKVTAVQSRQKYSRYCKEAKDVLERQKWKLQTYYVKIVVRLFMIVVVVVVYLTCAIQKRDNIISDSVYIINTERKNPLKRDQASNDATSGQIGEELRPEPSPSSSKPSDNNVNEQRLKSARKISRDLS